MDVGGVANNKIKSAFLSKYICKIEFPWKKVSLFITMGHFTQISFNFQWFLWWYISLFFWFIIKNINNSCFYCLPFFLCFPRKQMIYAYRNAYLIFLEWCRAFGLTVQNPFGYLWLCKLCGDSTKTPVPPLSFATWAIGCTLRFVQWVRFGVCILDWYVWSHVIISEIFMYFFMSSSSLPWGFVKKAFRGNPDSPGLFTC